MTEAEALKQFIPILGRISTPYERATIVMRVNERINAKDRTHLLGVSYRHIAALAWPSDPAHAKQFEDKLTAAVDAGEFVSLIRDGKHLQIEELAAWPDCPSIAPNSPLVYWLGEPAPATDTAPTQEAAPEVPELDYSLLATPAELLDAFGKWGLKAEWFDDLNSRKWLFDARRKKGQGQRGQVIEPLYCPFAVMNGLIAKVRKATRIQADTGWRTLEHKFPKVYAAFVEHDPRDQTGD